MLSYHNFHLTAFHNDCIPQDPMFLTRLHLRTLLDRGQAELAAFVRLPPRGDISPSGLWRIFLGGEDGRRPDDERLQVARRALTARRAQTPTQQHIQAVLDNPDAMRLLTERNSAIRQSGNYVAHQLMDESFLQEGVTRITEDSPADRRGLFGILTLVTVANSSST